ncbi:MAG: hypothetical protein ISS57_05255 [Anaerolineales bacterium]|nr:hypothetical protein [Chloroflexota bacterium]MBL7161994.1 hypothetical protein [Anaerolineales bacterium]
MEHDSQPNIISFVLRFVRESGDQPEDSRQYRGSIRHIQTDEEFVFTQWEDAINFIQDYVSIENMSIEDQQ